MQWLGSIDTLARFERCPYVVDGSRRSRPVIAGEIGSKASVFPPQIRLHYGSDFNAQLRKVLYGRLPDSNDATHVYGGTTSFTGTEFSSAGLANGDAVASLTLASAGAAGMASVGTYAITGAAAQGSGLSNYTIGYVNGALSVTPKVLLYVAIPAQWPFGSTGYALTGELQGFVNGDTPESAFAGTPHWSTSAGATTAPGVYAITGSGLEPRGPNYVLAQAGSNAQALRIFAPVASAIGALLNFKWVARRAG